jgi:hypothetical protein
MEWYLVKHRDNYVYFTSVCTNSCMQTGILEGGIKLKIKELKEIFRASFHLTLRYAGTGGLLVVVWF